MSTFLRLQVVSLVLVAGILSGCSQLNGTHMSNAEMRGQAVFNVHCADCHEQAHPELWKQPPKLEGMFRITSLPSGAPATDEQVRKTILEGRGTMPAFDHRLQEEDIKDLLKYLHTLK
jgi:mono/diheme cytochrome c family protein